MCDEKYVYVVYKMPNGQVFQNRHDRPKDGTDDRIADEIIKSVEVHADGFCFAHLSCERNDMVYSQSTTKMSTHDDDISVEGMSWVHAMNLASLWLHRANEITKVCESSGAFESTQACSENARACFEYARELRIGKGMIKS
jgi:hypothetical protein